MVIANMAGEKVTNQGIRSNSTGFAPNGRNKFVNSNSANEIIINDDADITPHFLLPEIYPANREGMKNNVVKNKDIAAI